MTYDSALYPRRDGLSVHPIAYPPVDRAAILWFAAALVPMLAGQIGRIYSGGDVVAWLACDYGWRIAAVGMLAAGPLRTIAFRRERSAVAWWEIVLWTIGVVLVERTAGGWLRVLLYETVGDGTVAAIPRTTGWLRTFDLTAGLALVATSEELLFRRCARAIIGRYLGDGAGMIIAAAVLFGAIHWWTGIPNIAAVALVGGYAMIAYRRLGVIWPLIVAHYFCDLIGLSAA